MKVSDICSRPAVCVGYETSVAEAAQLMRREHVGALVVTKFQQQGEKPLGILTDRDIAIGMVAPQLDPRTITAGDIMQRDLLKAQADEDLFAALRRMRTRGVRRLPVVDARDKVIGLLALDDVVETLVDEMRQIVKLVAREQNRESEARV